MKKIHEDENWETYEYEFENEGILYRAQYHKSKIDPHTQLPMHLSKQRVRFNPIEDQKEDSPCTP